MNIWFKTDKSSEGKEHSFMRTTDKETWPDTEACTLRMSRIDLGEEQYGGESGVFPRNTTYKGPLAERSLQYLRN